MKKMLALLLCISLLLTGCTVNMNVENDSGGSSSSISQTDAPAFKEEPVPQFSNLADEALRNYMEGVIYKDLVSELDSEKYFVENISTTYVSKEYLAELEYNSKENIYFGHTLSELNEVFQGTRYVFTLGPDGTTQVEAFESYDYTFEKVATDVVIGSGVILICATVSIVTAPSVPAVSLIFATSAKEAATIALSSGGLGGLMAGIIEGQQTGDFEKAIKAAALAAGEGFKWGAISGAIESGISETGKYAKAMKALKGAKLNGLTIQQAAMIQMKSGYPVDVIKAFTSMEQYNICEKARLSAKIVNGRTALIRKIDLDYKDADGMTNLMRMRKGKPPLDPTGISYELHHVGQKTDSTLAILTQSEHRLGENHKIWHLFGEGSDNPSVQAGWAREKSQFWKAMANILAPT